MSKFFLIIYLYCIKKLNNFKNKFINYNIQNIQKIEVYGQVIIMTVKFPLYFFDKFSDKQKLYFYKKYITYKKANQIL
jgi:hypothetical protein